MAAGGDAREAAAHVVAEGRIVVRIRIAAAEGAVEGVVDGGDGLPIALARGDKIVVVVIVMLLVVGGGGRVGRHLVGIEWFEQIVVRAAGVAPSAATAKAMLPSSNFIFMLKILEGVEWIRVKSCT
ncbi:hypothetical protein [Nitrosospira multiformis]|uniref:hypothetical protein n=1 Tax=Nitrosospira multiformis TaxID=1231 RepID=UPI00094547AF|nr:hypothetical protein [Nitrosospira multiformis]